MSTAATPAATMRAPSRPWPTGRSPTFSRRIEDSLGDELDVDLQGGILTIELATGGQYVINKHAPNRQIWLSSPVSGASHFGHEPGRGWISTRGGAVLHELLAQELSAATGTRISLRSADVSPAGLKAWPPPRPRPASASPSALPPP